MSASTDRRPPPGDNELRAHFDALPVLPPDDLTERIMAAVPDHPGSIGYRLGRWWPTEGRWLAPALAGATAAVVFMTALWLHAPIPGGTSAHAGVTFVVHAPAARQVELVGSFNAWQPGEIRLSGPDATGRWTATVPLPEGRHEYLFLVDGKEWITDPGASFHRADGFGHRNAVIDVESEEQG
jgi:hypothetical protein